ncbi:MAG: HEAT repeat domain-containing protein, partial [Planctomycetota bacterium]
AALAVETLIDLGPDGAHGLVLSLGTKNPETKIRVIEALGATGNAQAATPLSSFLIKTDRDVPRQLREAARAAITAIGEPGVPYLIEGLKRPHTRLHTGLLLREITGQQLISKPGPWMAWWKKTHPKWRRK